jgi:ABC-type oligopeptide transport system substrate-binding subunit
MIVSTPECSPRLRWLRFLLLAGAAVLFLSACGPPAAGETEATAGPLSSVAAIVTRIVEQTVIVTTTPNPAQEKPSTVENVVLDLSLEGTLPDLDPHVAGRQSQLDLVENLFIGLTNHNPATNTIEPELAESWEVGPDGRTWTFKLRDDVNWVRAGNRLPGDEGPWPVEAVRPVVADDVVFAIQRLCGRQVENAVTYTLFLIEGCERVFTTPEPTEADLESIGIRALDATTLEVKLTKSAGQFLTLTSTPLFTAVPRDLVDEFGNEWETPAGDISNGWQTPDNLVTSGPFVLVPGELLSTRMVLGRNTLWPLARPGNVDQVNVYFLDDETDAYELWQARTLDVAPLPSTEREAFLKQSPERATLVPEQVLFYIGFNFDNQVFREPEMRRAFSAAIDRQRLVDEIYGGTGLPARHATVPGVIGAVPIDEVGVGYSPDYARQQLDASTFRSCRLMPPVTFQVSSADLSLRQAEIIRDMWVEELDCPKENIAIEQVPFGALLANTRRDSGGARPALWDLAWAPAFADAHNLLTDLLHCEDSENRQNRPCDEADALMRRATGSIDAAERSELYRQAENLLFGENGTHPIAPLYLRGRDLVAHNWLSFTPSTFGGEQYDTYVLDYNLKRLESEAREQP